MTRVSENSYTASLNYSINKAKEKMENLQSKGASLKNINKPSDDPLGNVESLSLKSIGFDNRQYLRNINYSLLQLNTTESALEQLNDIIVRTKDLAIQQSSDFYDENIRKNIANEVVQLQKQILAIANKRVGNRYIFGGYSTLKEPFDLSGKYYGDNGHIKLEVAKDFFVPINVSGLEVFFDSSGPNEAVDSTSELLKPFRSTTPETPNENNSDESLKEAGRDLASTDNNNNATFKKRNNIFAQLATLIIGLENNDTKLIQESLVGLDETTSRLVSLRTRLGSIITSINYAQNGIESENVFNASHNSKLVDADLSELFSDITKQQDILKTVYQTTKGLLSQKLIDFLR